MQKKATPAAPAKSAQKAAKSTPRPAPAVAAAKAKKAQPVTAKAIPAKAPPGKQPAVKPATGKPATGKSAARHAPAAKKAAETRVGGAATVSGSPAPKPAREVSRTVAAKKAEAVVAKKTVAVPATRARGDRAAFFAKQRELLLEERRTYITSAEALKAQADSLALEHEPGDVQFDEEGGEGGTANVDREIDLYLSAQAQATVVEIDLALQKIADGSYGVCEQCGGPIPDARLQALPYAALCVSCKSGGLSSRR
jgi:DnaK suppressor protein